MNASKRGIVVQEPNIRSRPSEHDIASRCEIARRLAAIKGYAFARRRDEIATGDNPVYFVPDDTLTTAQARGCGIVSEDDLFGGVVPYPFVATKVITHPLIDEQGLSPAGWSHALAPGMAGCVLPGYAAFDEAAARAAAVRMLTSGPVRIKPALGIGGSGQYTVMDSGELDAALTELTQCDAFAAGVVIEQHLEEATTYSVGQVHVGPLDIAYCGTQCLTANNCGGTAYGGSRLYAVRGDLEALLRRKLSAPARTAVVHARHYDAAIAQAFPQLLASRRNYDVIRGRDAGGAWACGVLEQSWRVGGATPAEISALEAFQADPRLNNVSASCVEAYGDHRPPDGSVVYFDGIDSNVGRLVKYSQVHAREDPP